MKTLTTNPKVDGFAIMPSEYVPQSPSYAICNGAIIASQYDDENDAWH